MRKIAAIGLLSLATVSVWAWFVQPGLTPIERLVVWRHGSTLFTPDAWRRADIKTRGTMLRDLLRKENFLGKKNNEVIRVLGASTCYAGYDDEPCYVVDVSGQKRAFAFGVNHSDRPGIVVSLGLDSY